MVAAGGEDAIGRDRSAMWGLVRFSNPQNALLDVETFYGRGIFVILPEDHN